MVSTKQIADWANTGDAQRELPRLIRRLIHSTASLTQISMPAGDSTSLPGLDGELFSEHGNAWVPQGHSCWEASCRSDVTVKANEDYKKRSAEFDSKQAARRSYVAITARKWTGKNKWASERRAENLWADVRAYDAEDLEHWLEQSPPVSLMFGEELGIAGPGVTSLTTYLSSWLNQSEPKLTPKALLQGRDRHHDRLILKSEAGLQEESPNPVSLRADSVEEAVAFVCACLSTNAELALKAVVVTEASGWRFVEKNSEVRIAIAARPELADKPPARGKLLIVVPYASGDMAKQFRGVAGRLDDPETYLDRPDYRDFETALKDAGVDENDSRRLTDLCGRSWSVFRRQHAINPAIRRPAWLDTPAAAALGTLCLLGTWSTDRQADKEAVGRIAGRPYDELERDLLELEKLDDSPVLHIGTVWKAKSALELLSLYGDRITNAEVTRFFSEAKDLLSAPDPKLELPKSERYMAAIHGKVRPISGYLLDAVCDTLIKLAVRGPLVANLATMQIDLCVEHLVRELLADADAIRWLSLKSKLPALAEASPEAFMSAVEFSLSRNDAPVRQLIEETESAGVFGSGCWHSGLLWAYEMLAWAPQRLTRVSITLARLSETPVKGNWVNTPANSLTSIYRSWFPQTAATIEQRIAALDVIIAKHPAAGSALLNSLTNVGHDVAHHTARPKWRDDDAGAGYGASGQDRHAMLVAAADRQLRLAAQNVDQIIELVRKYSDFDDARRETVIDLVKGLIDHSDEEKEKVRSTIRSKLHWHRNYDTETKDLQKYLEPLEVAYEELLPSDPMISFAWLFESNWVDLPLKDSPRDIEGRGETLEKLRLENLKPFFASESWSGVVRLAEYSRAGWQIGYSLFGAGLTEEEAIDWLSTSSGELDEDDARTRIANGLCAVLFNRHGIGALDRIFAASDPSSKSRQWTVRVLTFAPDGREKWDYIEKLGPEVEEAFWSQCRVWIQNDDEDLNFVVTKLLLARRPMAAFNVCRFKYGGVSAELITQMLEGLFVEREEDAQIPQYWDFQKAFDYLEQSGEIDEMRLAKLEFGLIKALGFEGEHHAVSLYRVLMAQPELFIELLSLVYRKRGDPPRDPETVNKEAAENAWAVLHACKRMPGSLPDDSVTTHSMRTYLETVRKLAEEADRLEVCDVTIGEIMARSPDGADGIFPCEAVREALEEINSKELFNGFYVGCHNKRGVTCRGPLDGGEQERSLAENYRANAKALEITHPFVSAALENLAKSYERDGEREDTEARLRRESL